MNDFKIKTIGNTIPSALIGTSMMTLFSYLYSLIESDNFSEPEHLATLFHRLVPGSSKKKSQLEGWIAHYVVGVMFFAIYQELWKADKIKKSVSNAFILGTLNGVFGALVWRTILKNHPTPPNINFKKYLLQLIPAHIIFSISATLTSILLNQKVKKLDK
ncbi:hypothetical protein ABIB40_002536 [Pedobacter sp. UYP30]|uniref:hypothetical protein n=1 Tax=Pedobacter sp. UYP30 TaxID=1756400 RepID=UPI003395443B